MSFLFILIGVEVWVLLNDHAMFHFLIPFQSFSIFQYIPSSVQLYYYLLTTYLSIHKYNALWLHPHSNCPLPHFIDHLSHSFFSVSFFTLYFYFLLNFILYFMHVRNCMKPCLWENSLFHSHVHPFPAKNTIHIFRQWGEKQKKVLEPWIIWAGISVANR